MVAGLKEEGYLSIILVHAQRDWPAKRPPCLSLVEAIEGVLQGIGVMALAQKRAARCK